MKIVTVSTPKHIREFLEFPPRLYKGDPSYIRPLDKDIEEIFDTDKNKLLRQGECCRWLLLDDTGKTIGKVAAYINQKTLNQDNDQPTGGMGFFDCINDQKAANMLFDTCKAWLEERGAKAMDGPINFGERDKWWGCLAEGFTEPNYCMPYNYPYYQDLFRGYGFQTYFKQYTYFRIVRDPLIPKVHDKAQRIVKNPDFTFDHLHLSNVEKYTLDFQTIYNKAWGKHAGVRTMSLAQARRIMKAIKPVVEEELVRFTYYKGEPVAFFIMLPELNQIFKYLNGKFDLWAKLKFLWYKRRKVCKKMFGVVFGVIPEHQGKGVEAAIIVNFAETVAWSDNFQYKELEMNWIGDFNPKMMRVVEDIGGKIYKTHITFRKLFDETVPFKRMRIIN